MFLLTYKNYKSVFINVIILTFQDNKSNKGQSLLLGIWLFFIGFVLVEIFKIDLLTLIVSPGKTWDLTFRDIVKDETVNKIYITENFDQKEIDTFGNPFLSKIVKELGIIAYDKDNVKWLLEDLVGNTNNTILVGKSVITRLWFNSFNEKKELIIPDATQMGYEMDVFVLRGGGRYTKTLIDL